MSERVTSDSETQETAAVCSNCGRPKAPYYRSEGVVFLQSPAGHCWRHTDSGVYPSAATVDCMRAQVERAEAAWSEAVMQRDTAQETARIEREGREAAEAACAAWRRRIGATTRMLDDAIDHGHKVLADLRREGAEGAAVRGALRVLEEVAATIGIADYPDPGAALLDELARLRRDDADWRTAMREVRERQRVEDERYERCAVDRDEARRQAAHRLTAITILQGERDLARAGEAQAIEMRKHAEEERKYERVRADFAEGVTALLEQDVDRLTRERDAVRIDLEAARLHSARHRAERDAARELADAEVERLRRLTEQQADAAEQVRRERDEQAVLAARALERERLTHQQAAAMREALQAFLDGRALRYRNDIEWAKFVVTSNAGKGYLAPTGQPGCVAVEVADGLAWVRGWGRIGQAGSRVVALVGVPLRLIEGEVTDFDDDNGPIELAIMDAGGMRWTFAPTIFYVDRARCIRAVVAALDEIILREVIVRAVPSATLLASSSAQESIAAADPDALLAALQAVTAP